MSSFQELSSNDDENKIVENKTNLSVDSKDLNAKKDEKIIRIGSPIILSRSLLTKLSILFVFYAVGVIFYHVNEGWNVLDCIYFITVTISTVGYGFFHPTNPSSKTFSIFFIVIGVSLIYTIITEVSREVFTNFQEFVVYKVMHSLYKRTNISTNEMNKYKIVVSLITVAVFILIGALFYSGNENWTFLDGVYWCVITLSTVGYGDLTVLYESTRLYGIFYIIVCTTIFAVAVNNVLDAYYYTWTGAETVKDNNNNNKVIGFKNAPNFVDDSIITKEKLIISVLKTVDENANNLIEKITQVIDLDGELSYTNESINHYIKKLDQNVVKNPLQENV